MTAIDDLIVNLNEHRTSSRSEPIVTRVSQNVLAWQQVLTAIGAGGVSSVALSLPTEFNVTGSPGAGVVSIAATWKSENANTIFAAPNGAPGTPSFRSLVAGDIPALSSIYLPLSGGTMTGQEMIADGSAAAPGLAVHVANAGMYYETSDPAGNIRPIAFSMAGAYVAGFSSTGLNVAIPGGGGAQVTVIGEGTATHGATRSSANTSAPGFLLTKSRGTIAAPAIIATNDLEGTISFRGAGAVSGSSLTAVVGAQIEAQCIDTTPSSTAMGSNLIFQACAIGAAALTEVARIDTANGFSMFGSNPVIDGNRLHRLRSFTVATLPTFVAGALAYVTDATLTAIVGLGLAPAGGGTNQVPVYADNVGWKII